LVNCVKELQFKKALEYLYLYCDKTLSNFYFDCSKNTLYLRKAASEQRELLQCGLYELLNALFDFVKVFCPFVAEEFHQDFYGSVSNSVFVKNYFSLEKLDFLNNLETKVNWEHVLEARKLVQSKLEPMQQAKQVKSRTEVNALLTCPFELKDQMLFLQNNFDLGELFGVCSAQLEFDMNWNVLLQDLKLNNAYQKCPRCWNFELVSGFKDNLCNKCDNDEN
jgi:isoleucyl-tRNA synthetase